MTDPDPQPRTIRLVAVEHDLAEHVIDLLDAAGIVAVPVAGSGPEDALTTIAVDEAQAEHARATLDLVLPGLLAEEATGPSPDTAAPRLSGRLIRRSDWTTDATRAVSGPAGEEPEGTGAGHHRLIDGRQAFAEALDPGEGSPAYHDPAEEADYIPPPPPPIPRGDTISRFAWLGAVGGPILMVLTALLDLPSTVAAVGLTGFVIGFGVLVARMPDRGRTDDGWDDGAVL